jgi:hypothetical protein
VYVACTEAILGSGEEKMLSENTAKRVCKLFDKHSVLFEAMRKKSDDNDAEGKKKRKAAAAAVVGDDKVSPNANKVAVQPTEQLIGTKVRCLKRKKKQNSCL